MRSRNTIGRTMTNPNTPKGSEIGDIAQEPVVFQEHRSVLPAQDRVAWRLSILILTLAKFRGGRAAIHNLHLILWALSARGTRALMLSWWKGLQPVDLATVRFDPGLEITLALAAAEDLVLVGTKGRVELTSRGSEFAALIDADVDLLMPEKEMLRQLSPLNDANVTRHMGGVGFGY
jgi:hypothetical protein